MARQLTDVSELTTADAVSQWRSVAQRAQPTGTQRQVRFLPIEDVLCFGLFRLVAPNAFGSNNIDDVPDEVKRLARTLKRPASSLVAKMCNLADLRSNGQAADVAVFVALTDRPELAASLGRRVVDAARHVGFEEDAVPDLWRPEIGFDADDPIGQDEIGDRELQRAFEEHARSRAGATSGGSPIDRQTERVVEMRVRQGQRYFATRVLRNFAHRCGFCGMTSPAQASVTLLRASHIKPWCESTSGERLDVTNGIAACPTHDAAFDQGLLVVNGGYRIHRATALRTWLAADPAAQAAFGPNAIHEALSLPKGGLRPDPRYLTHHRARWQALYA